jgi:DNA-binding transcriptional regulator YiaG
MKKTRTEKCEHCGEGKRVPFPFLVKRQLDAQAFSGEVPATRCDNCGEELVSGPGLGLFDSALTARLARSGSIGPQGFRWLRGRAGLEAKQLAALLDVSPGTVSRWENGKKPLERRAVALVASLALEALGEHTSTRDLLGQLASARKPARRVRLDIPRSEGD